MQDRTVRITNITIKNFKNVKNGTVDLINRRKDYKASLLGLYGQNRSGKTALIEAVQLQLCAGNIQIFYFFQKNDQYVQKKLF